MILTPLLEYSFKQYQYRFHSLLVVKAIVFFHEALSCVAYRETEGESVGLAAMRAFFTPAVVEAITEVCLARTMLRF